MEARRVYEDGEAFDQFEWLEAHVGGAMAPAVSEAVDETAVRSLGQSVGREGGPRGVAGQPLEPSAVVCGNGDGGVQADAAAADAAGSL
jgi:hypothetical protein